MLLSKQNEDEITNMQPLYPQAWESKWKILMFFFMFDIFIILFLFDIFEIVGTGCRGSCDIDVI
jgi:hypothetical protein